MVEHTARAALLDAVPSFGPRWERWTADHADYVKRFPEERLTEAELSFQFLNDLATHVGKRFATGERHEVTWLFAALEPILADADPKAWTSLTVGFLESLIYSVEAEGGDAASLAAFATGEAIGRAWRASYDYTHPASHDDQS